MNYMQAVDFVEITTEKVEAHVLYQRREEFFRYHHQHKKIVPWYIIIEAIFQTGGRLIREATGGKKAGIIISFRNFHFARPLLPSEHILINVKLQSLKEDVALVDIQLISQKKILETGQIMFGLRAEIVSEHLNNHMPGDLSNNISYFEENIHGK